MKKFKQQLSKILNKVKSSRSLQVTITLVIGVLLLYHYLFGDIGNWNVKIESIVQKNAYRVDDRARDSIFSVSLQNDKLKINKYSKIELEKKYCSNVDSYHKILRILSFDPIIVECDSMKDIYYEVVTTDGKTFHRSGYSETRYSWSYPIKDKRGEYMYKDIEIKLPEKNMSVSAIEKKYCQEFNLTLRKINTFDPMEVVCGYPDSARTRYYTNGKWMHVEKELDDRVVGQNEQYLLLGNYSLVNKRNGEITENNYIYRTSRDGINGIGTVSENRRFFINKGIYNSIDTSIAEINKQGEAIVLYKFNSYIFFKTAHIIASSSSHNGNYVFMLVNKISRGLGTNLLFYIIDVRNKSLLYRKTLVGSYQQLRNIDISNISNHSDKILFNYAVDGDVYAYKVVLKK